MKSNRYVSQLVRRIAWGDLDEGYLRRIIELAREEDVCGLGLAARPEKGADITTMTLAPGTRASASLVARREMVVCGMKLVPLVLDVYSSRASDEPCRFEAAVSDGERVGRGAVLGRIEGGGRVMLQAERVMLNFIQRLSGVATETAKYVAALGDSKTMLLDTRKTTPCFRALEKYAFACGGGYNHRMGLFDRVMLKDNHLACSGASSGSALTGAVVAAREANPGIPVEVEVDSLAQIPPALEAEPDVIMLDNFSLSDLERALKIIGDAAWTEASGGVNLDTLADIGRIGPDFVSSGAPIHSSSWIDIGLDD